MTDDGGLEHGELDIAGVRRTYWLARGANPQAPLLMMLPGSGTTGKDVAVSLPAKHCPAGQLIRR